MKWSEMPFSFKLSSVCAIVSLALAYAVRVNGACYESLGYVLLGVWVLLPPLWFLYEFAKDFPNGDGLDGTKMDRLKHLQELSRNIWLAFIIVLAAIMKIKWPLD